MRLTTNDKISYARKLAASFARKGNTRGAVMADGMVQHMLAGKPLTAGQYSWLQHNLYIHLNIEAPINDADNERDEKRGAGRPTGSKTKRTVNYNDTLLRIYDTCGDCFDALTDSNGDSNG